MATTTTELGEADASLLSKQAGAHMSFEYARGTNG